MSVNRLLLMKIDQLFDVVRPSGIVRPEQLLEAIEEKRSKTPPYRGASCKKLTILKADLAQKRLWVSTDRLY